MYLIKQAKIAIDLDEVFKVLQSSCIFFLLNSQVNEDKLYVKGVRKRNLLQMCENSRI